MVAMVASYSHNLLLAQGQLPRWRGAMFAGALLLAALTFVSHARAVLTDVRVDATGRVAATGECVDLAALPCAERKWNGCRRYCRICELPKPDRAHHCATCGGCVLRLDHHCVFLANCVGFHNAKFFILFLSYATLTSAYMSATLYLQHAGPLGLAELVFRRPQLRSVGLTIMMGIILALALGIFLAFHLYLLALNLTTLEFNERVGERRHGQRIGNPFRLSLWRNVRQIMGASWWAWPLPTRWTVPGRGLVFPAR